MGHVPSGPLRQASQGDDVPRRQHRGTGTLRRHLSARQHRLARFGEGVAAGFLQRRGATIVGRNVRVGRGELDLVVRLAGRLVAVEVKTVGAAAVAESPIDRLTSDKIDQVAHLAQTLGGSVRVDFIGVVVRQDGVLVNWRPAVW